MMVECGQTILQQAASASSGAVAGLSTPATAGVPPAAGGARAAATTPRVSGSCWSLRVQRGHPCVPLSIAKRL
jgi:hypothetical protein